MLKVFPIQSKEEQKNICQRCSVEYNADLMAYAATVDDALVGVCQFILSDEGGIIHDIASVDGKDSFEAMFVLGRATLNFIDLCGVHYAVCLDKNLDPSLAKAIGFSRGDDGRLSVDLTGFFDNPCAHSK